MATSPTKQDQAARSGNSANRLSHAPLTMVTTLAKSMDPSDMPPCQRLGELSALLAGGLLRLWLKRRKERVLSGQLP